MQSTPQEIYDLIKLSVAEKDAEIAVLRKEVECLKEENMKLRVQSAEMPDENIGCVNGVVIDVDALCNLLSELNDVQLSAFLYLAIQRILAGNISAETMKRIQKAVNIKKCEGVNILSKGDWIIDKLTNLSTLISAQRIEALNAV